MKEQSKASRIRAHEVWPYYQAATTKYARSLFARRLRRELGVTSADIIAAKRSKSDRRGPTPKLPRCEKCNQAIRSKDARRSHSAKRT